MRVVNTEFIKELDRRAELSRKIRSDLMGVMVIIPEIFTEESVNNTDLQPKLRDVVARLSEFEAGVKKTHELTDEPHDCRVSLEPAAQANAVIKRPKPKIVPNTVGGASRTSELPETLTVKDITKVLGFKPNICADNEKVKYEWSFTVDGKQCGIWDYRGSRWSTYDPSNILKAIFDAATTSP